jgi:hypothetical protein
MKDKKKQGQLSALLSELHIKTLEDLEKYYNDIIQKDMAHLKSIVE